MNSQQIAAAIDEEISRLQQVKALLDPGGRGASGRTANLVQAPKKRILSDEARAKIAAAQRKRWAAQKKAQK